MQFYQTSEASFSQFINELDLPLNEYIKTFRPIVNVIGELIQNLHEDNVQVPYWKKDIELLTLKFVLHCNSVFKLYEGTDFIHPIDKSIVHLLDETSIIPLMRVILENYLTLYYLYFDLISDNEKEFRYKVWRYSALQKRSTVEFSTEVYEGKDLLLAKKDHEAKVAANLYEEIKGSEYFKTKYKQEIKFHQFTKGYQPRLYSFNRIMKDADVKNQIISTIYFLQSQYAHSEYISILQLKEKKLNFLNQRKVDPFLMVTNLICSRLLYRLTLEFTSIKIRFNAMDEEFIRRVLTLSRFAADEKLIKL